MNKENLHKGHRQRLRAKYMKNCGVDMDDHQLLELLLFYSVPLKDTNDTAHLLLNRFGSVKGVFDADIHELMSIDGIGENSAILVKLIASLMSRYSLCEVDLRKPIKTFSDISNYLSSLYIGESNETVYLLLFNNSMRLLKTELLFRGSVNDVSLNTRMLVEAAYNYKASYVILAHNHPGGIAVPSSEDIELTYRLSRAMACVGIDFIDHFVVAANRCTPILHGAQKDRESLQEERLQNLRVPRSELEEDLKKIFTE